MASAWPSVAVMGGSLGGLTVALLLRDLGCDVHVYERSPDELQGRGAGIVLHPMTTRYLRERADTGIGAIATSAPYRRYLDRSSTVIDLTEPSYQFISYGALYRALLSQFDRDRYHLGCEIVDVERHPEAATVVFSDGARATSDLLVCADGSASRARGLLLGPVERRYAGYVAWRGVVDERDLSQRTATLLGDAITYHALTERHSHILTYPIPNTDGDVSPGRRLMNFVWYRNVEQGGELDTLLTDRDGKIRELSVPPGAVQDRFVDELRAAARELPTELMEVVQATAEPFLQVIYDVQVPRMALSPICLIGDAAFTVRPHAAAASAKSAADGWALADALGATDGDVAKALERWEPGQLDLGTRLARRTQEMGDRSQRHGTWRAGDRSLDFGLYGPGE